MNANQKRQQEEARAKSIRDSYCINATGKKSMGREVPSSNVDPMSPVENNSEYA